jgi:hypothetical protein
VLTQHRTVLAREALGVPRAEVVDDSADEFVTGALGAHASV